MPNHSQSKIEENMRNKQIAENINVISSSEIPFFLHVTIGSIGLKLLMCSTFGHQLENVERDQFAPCNKTITFRHWTLSKLELY